MKGVFVFVDSSWEEGAVAALADGGDAAPSQT